MTHEEMYQKHIASGLSFSQIAKRMGVSFGYLLDLQRGAREITNKAASAFNNAVEFGGESPCDAEEKAAWDARTLNGIEHSRCDYFVAGFKAGRNDNHPPTLALHDTGPSEFKQWYVENVFDIATEPIGSRSYHWMKKAWDARDAVFPRNSVTAELLEALKAVVAIADRKTVEFDAAKAAIARAEGAI